MRDFHAALRAARRFAARARFAADGWFAMILLCCDSYGENFLTQLTEKSLESQLSFWRAFGILMPHVLPRT
jgi:hypothetical protein